MMLLGVLTTKDAAVATASVVKMNGETEKEVSCIVAPDAFQALALILYDVRLIAIREAQIYTNDKALLSFLTPPIQVRPTTTTKVKPLFQPNFPLISVPTGGDSWQWDILHSLFYFNRWQVKFAAKLPNTEMIYAEYYTSGSKPGAQGSARRLEPGVWTVA